MLSLIITLIIFAIAGLQLAQVGVTYVQNRTQLDAAKQQEAELSAQKAELEDQISRWNDQAYVEAQARSRLGFVYSGEKPVYLINTGRDADASKSATNSTGTSNSTMPWYKELLYSLQKSDESTTGSTDATVGGALGTKAQSGSSSGSSASSSTDSASTDATASTGTASTGTADSSESTDSAGSAESLSDSSSSDASSSADSPSSSSAAQ